MKLVLIGVAVLVLGSAATMWFISRQAELPSEVVPIAWEHEQCAHCHAAVGTPERAAELVTTDGRVLGFDRVECAADWIAKHKPPVHRLWFHTGQGWLAAEAVRFETVAEAGRGSALVAVERAIERSGAGGGVSWSDVVAARALAR